MSIALRLALVSLGITGARALECPPNLCNTSRLPRNCTDLSNALGCGANGITANLADWDTSHITSLANLFQDWVTLPGGNDPMNPTRKNGTESVTGISNWDTSNVTNFAYVFKRSRYNKSLFWDVSKGRHFEEMFLRSDFDQDISWWNVSQAADANSFDRIFYGSAYSLGPYANKTRDCWASSSTAFNTALGSNNTGLRHITPTHLNDTEYAAQCSRPSSPDSDDSDDDALKIGLGVGLGVGIPLVATVAYFAHKRLRTGTRASTALDVADVLLGVSK